jgi:archaellum component FlaF (FlaF/FlaG flagellin family)
MTGGWSWRRHSLGATLIGAMVATSSVLVVAPASAAAPAAPGTPIAALPFSATAGFDIGSGTGGSGSAAANAAVKQQCNAGVELYNPQWFTVPVANLGKIYVHGTAWGVGARSPEDFPFGVAVVDTTTGAVLTCGEDPISATTAKPLSVVIYFATSHANCDPNEYPGCDGQLHLQVNTTTGVAPSNDEIVGAKTITALPYTDKVDTFLADNDGPELIDYDHCMLSSINRDQSHTVWWKFTPATTISAPVVSVVPSQNPGPEDFRPWASIMVSTPTGLVLPPKTDEWNCDPPTELTAGTTYYFAVFTPWDSYYDRPLTTGGPVTLTVTGTAAPKSAPAAPAGLTATKNDVAATATLSWTPPPSNGGSPITGYRVSRNGTDTGNTGPWSAVVPATARSQTFKYLLPWDTYTLQVQAITAIGTGPATGTQVTLTAPTPSSPQTIVATPGAGRATVTWAAPAHGGSSAITGYRVRRFLGSATTAQSTTTLPASTRSFIATGLIAGTGYSFDVQAVNAAGAGRISARSRLVTVLALPSVPTAVTASANGPAKTVTLTWAPPTSTGGSPITGYRVARNGTDSGGTGPWSTVLPATARTITFKYLLPGSSYSVNVRAVTAAGTGAAASKTVTLPAAALGATPN